MRYLLIALLGIESCPLCGAPKGHALGCPYGKGGVV